MGFADRLLTIAVTATLTSAAWIVVGNLEIEPESPVEPTKAMTWPWRTLTPTAAPSAKRERWP